MGWVDTHCHLQLTEESPDELIRRAEDVDWMLVPGVDAATSRQAAGLAARHPHRLLYSAGLHPHSATRWEEESEQIQELIGPAAAVGETGLDYYRGLAPRDRQREAFRAHLELAVAHDKPVIVHCRDAFADVHHLLEVTGAADRAVLHCWTGGRRWTRRFLELGVVFSFAGLLAFETGETIRLAAELVPPQRAMVETDTPHLAPPPHRGERNEPAYVIHTGTVLARLWDVAVDEAARLTSATAARVFGAPS